MRQTTVRKSRQHSKVSVLAFLVLLVVSGTGLALWRFQSVQVLSVESASMAPEIKRGDAVVIQPVTFNDLKVDDVVSYRSPADQSVIVTHRVVAVERNWNQLITKGDNAARIDTPLPPSEIIGRVQARVKYLGFVLNFLRSPAGLIVGVYIPALIIVLLEVKRLVMYYSKPTYRLATYTKTR